jgi:hypothetical protein
MFTNKMFSFINLKSNSQDRSDIESDIVIKSNEELLNKRRFTMLSNSEERLINEDMDNEEIIEGFSLKLRKS